MHWTRSSVLYAVLLGLLAGSVAAQNVAQNNKKIDPDAGYIPVVAPEEKTKKKKPDETQALALPPELPIAVVAETGRLAFHVAPLSSKGLLSQQVRDALKNLLHSSHGAIVMLRAFVAGSGDLRRVGEITGDLFQEKHLPLPALTVVQVGALPLEGAQVALEATELDRKIVNPQGVAFLAAQPAANVSQSLTKLKTLLAGHGMQPSNALLVTCYISSLDDQRDTRQAMSSVFPGAALDYVQAQRAPITPAAACEARARLSDPASLNDAPSNDASGGNSQIAVVSGPEVVITGTQMAFGNQDRDFNLAFERLDKALAEKGASLKHVVLSHLYVTSSTLASRVLTLEKAGSARSVLPVESLPSLDCSFGLDVVAVPDTAAPASSTEQNRR